MIGSLDTRIYVRDVPPIRPDNGQQHNLRLGTVEQISDTTMFSLMVTNNADDYIHPINYPPIPTTSGLDTSLMSS